MSTNKNNYPAMRYIKFTINTKKKYDELAKLTQGMQEEGRKWRELYYKSVTKD